MLYVQCAMLRVQCVSIFILIILGKNIFPAFFKMPYLCSTVWDVQSHCHKCHQRQLHVWNIWVFDFCFVHHSSGCTQSSNIKHTFERYLGVHLTEFQLLITDADQQTVAIQFSIMNLLINTVNLKCVYPCDVW